MFPLWSGVGGGPTGEETETMSSMLVWRQWSLGGSEGAGQGQNSGEGAEQWGGGRRRAELWQDGGVTWCQFVTVGSLLQ